jgi:hypothetical protein
VLKQYNEALVNKLAKKAEELHIANQGLERHAAQLQMEINERKRAAEELSASELRFRQLAENVKEVFFLIDAKSGKMLYVVPPTRRSGAGAARAIYEDPKSWANSSTSTTGKPCARTKRYCSPPGISTWSTGSYAWTRACAGSGSAFLRSAMSRARSADWPAWPKTLPNARNASGKIARLTRIYAVLSAIDSAIVRIRDRDLLFREACRIAVDEGAFKMAWIGEVDRDTLESKIVASSGLKQVTSIGFAFNIRSESTGSNWPTSRAVREKRPIVHNDISTETDACAAPRRAPGARASFRRSVPFDRRRTASGGPGALFRGCGFFRRRGAPLAQ